MWQQIKERHTFLYTKKLARKAGMIKKEIENCGKKQKVLKGMISKNI